MLLLIVFECCQVQPRYQAVAPRKASMKRLRLISRSVGDLKVDGADRAGTALLMPDPSPTDTGETSYDR